MNIQGKVVDSKVNKAEPVKPKTQKKVTKSKKRKNLPEVIELESMKLEEDK